jgi:phospholipid/cholesterol/gamma-HCH transport system substrate-binding protein
MKKESKVGLFIIVSLLIFFYLIIKVGDIHLNFKKKGYKIYSSFDQTAGLLGGAAVRLAGVKIGKVLKIYLKNGKAEVIMLINNDIKILQDSKASVSSFGIMGEKYIEIIPGTGGLFVQDGGKIRGIAPLSIDQIGALFYSIGQDIKTMGTTIKDIFTSEEGEYRLKTIIKNMAETTNELNKMSKEVRKMIPEIVNDSKEEVGKLNSSVLSIAKRVESLTKSLESFINNNRNHLTLGMKNFEQLGKNLEKISREISDMAAQINQGKGTAGKLLKDDKLYKDIKATILSAKDSIKRIKTSINKAGKTTLSYGFNTYYYGENRYRNLLITSLNFDSKSIGFTVTEDPFSDRYLYGIYAEQKVGIFKPRVGILDSSFGIGLKLYPINNVGIDFMMYDFKNRDYPRWRLSGYLFSKNGFNLSAGYENRDRGNKFFFGIGYYK